LVHAARNGNDLRLVLMKSHVTGFTLIETLIVMAIVGVLAALAYPGFVAQVQQTRRADALSALMQVEAAQARFRSNASRYGTLVEIGVAATSAAGHYVLQATDNTADGFVAVAVAAGAQTHDATCRYIRINVVGGNTTYQSGPDATAANPIADNQKCWSL
jgi:type IV pilus assembly protein PilE